MLCYVCGMEYCCCGDGDGDGGGGGGGGADNLTVGRVVKAKLFV